MIEDFINALQNFRRSKTRTILSLLGVIIGVASVIVIMSMGTSSTQQIARTFGSSGLDMVNVTYGIGRRQREAVQLSFNESFREKMFDAISGIKKIWFINKFAGTASYGETSVTIDSTAVEYGYLESYGLLLEEGNFFSVTDEVYGAQKVVIGSEVATMLFPNGEAVGNRITLTAYNVNYSFEVIGVLKEQVSGMENATSGFYVSRGFYNKKITPNSEASELRVQAVSPSRASSLVGDITNYTSALTGTDYSVRVISMQSMMDQMNEITNTMSVMLSAIAAISLLVGGIGIMNIMIVTVTERKQEIGIRKALGATPAAIRQQFLVESASITLMGGAVGIVLGIVISLAVEYVRSLSFVISISSCIVAFGFSAFVGIFFGLSPASRAAKLDPVVALSDE